MNILSFPRYSVGWVDLYIDSLIDKMGSDYFPLPVKMERFKTMTYDFIRESTEYLEYNQEISDDLQPLLVSKKSDIEKETSGLNTDNIWNVPEPADYCRLVSVTPIITDPVTGSDMVKAKEVKIVKEGQRNSYKRDPFRKASAEYPNVYRLANFFKIDVGPDKSQYHKALLSYIKNPTFANITDSESRIVNLSNIAIEMICMNTADSLRVGVSDPGAASNYQFNAGFGKKGK